MDNREGEWETGNVVNKDRHVASNRGFPRKKEERQ